MMPVRQRSQASVEQVLNVCISNNEDIYVRTKGQSSRTKNLSTPSTGFLSTPPLKWSSIHPINWLSVHPLNLFMTCILELEPPALRISLNSKMTDNQQPPIYDYTVCPCVEQSSYYINVLNRSYTDLRAVGEVRSCCSRKQLK
ncbi:hypothetical protein FHG87_014559 [Trinorchestia longiramus]|nr:hypothetical protein FHG87_014559 [Trinorchestia longiramus]